MCLIDEADPFEVYRKEQRIAAKPHRCYECGRKIDRGEPYQWATGLFDGRWDTFHTCRHCYVGGEWMFAICGGWCHGSLHEEIREHWDEEPDLRSWGLALWIECSSRQWRRLDGRLRPIPKPLRVPEAVAR